MSDVDWLRKAADELDDGGVHGQREWPEDDLCICGLDWSAQHRRDVAAAALLRALADERKSGMVVGDWDSGWKVVMKPLWVAALALADTILGVPNTGGSESGDVPYKNPADEYPREDGWGYG